MLVFRTVCLLRGKMISVVKLKNIIEPARLSLSNTPLPRPGTTSVGAQASAAGPVPRPDVQAWIERARESIQALGAFVEGEEDIDEEDDGDGSDEEYLDSKEDDVPWREPPAEQETDTEDGATEEDPEAKRRRILEESRDIDADSDGSEEDSSDEESDSEDEAADLMRELEKIKKERAAQKEKEVCCH